MGDGVAVVSGGLDSVTMAYHLHAGGKRPDVLAFDYGQRHARELDCSASAAKALGLRFDLVAMPELAHMLAPSGSALVGGGPVPEGHYAAETMRATVVPNRNMIMLAVAAGVCIARGGAYVATANHAGDHYIYPDCRPPFFAALAAAVLTGNEGFTAPGWHLETPFLYWSKAQIAAEAARLGVPVADTWSCYQGGSIHCGRCGTCVERAEAFAEAGLTDPTVYADPEYYRTATP